MLHTLVNASSTNSLSAAWTSFLVTQDAQFARLAAWRGEPYTHLSLAELAAAARLAAGFGLVPPHPA